MIVLPVVEQLRFWARCAGLEVDTCPVTRDLAVFSPCRRYRYALVRVVGPGERALIACGLNPSTADAVKNDQTVTKLTLYARLWGCGTLVVINTCAWRQTDADEMRAEADRGTDVVGPFGDAVVEIVLAGVRHTDIALAMWGAKVLPGRSEAMCRAAARAGVLWRCLGSNQGGTPKHPLYLPLATALRPWEQGATVVR